MAIGILLGCALGGLLLVVAGVALVSTAAALITAGVCALAATAAIAYLRGAS
jgi:hypothetical protein